MPKALASKDDDWLVGEMSPAVCWMDKSPRKTKNGITMVNYNKQDALERLCFGEFNIAYIRGLARALLAREGRRPAWCTAPTRRMYPVPSALVGRVRRSLSLT
jgi:hypothetical protein